MYLKKTKYLYILLLALSVSGYSQKHNYPSAVKTYPVFLKQMERDTRLEFLVEQVSYENILSILTYLETQGPRPSASGGNAVLNTVRDYIAAKLISWEYSVQYQKVMVSTFDHGDNVFVEKPGTKYPDKKIVIGAHYDSVVGGPGINDNGSGVATLLEMARIFSEREHEYTLIFVWFTGEEKGLYGSNVFSDSLKQNETDLHIMFNIDMVGGIKDQPMTNLYCEKGVNSTPTINAISKLYTDTLAWLTSDYTSLNPVIANAYASDYMPFQADGFVVTGLYEYVNGDNPYYHKSTDILANMDPRYLEQVIRGSVAFSAYVGRDISSYLLSSHEPAAEIDIEELPFIVEAVTVSDTGVNTQNFVYSLNGGDFTTTEMTISGVSEDSSFFSVELDSLPFGSNISYFLYFENDNGVQSRLPSDGYYDMQITGIENDVIIQPQYFDLLAAYPNPFNPSTGIDYRVFVPGKLEIDIFNITGNRIGSISEVNNTVGNHRFIWQPENVSSGTYFIRFRYNGSVSKSIKVVLLK